MLFLHGLNVSLSKESSFVPYRMINENQNWLYKMADKIVKIVTIPLEL
jgi:hypothetical protein